MSDILPLGCHKALINASSPRAINTRQQDKVKHAVLAFDRASRKARDRRRNGL